MARCDQQGALWVINRKESVWKTRFLCAAGNYPQRVRVWLVTMGLKIAKSSEC